MRPSDDEGDGFLRPKLPQSTVTTKQPQGCCYSIHTRNCCIATAVFGLLFVILGVVVLVLGADLIQKKVDESMIISPGSDRLDSWLKPPVDVHLTSYAFHISNVDDVLKKGAKPKLEEKGPYVYKAVYVKDTEGMVWSDDNTKLTYRPRRFYTYEPELSGPGLDPDNDYITVPNIPLWTGLAQGGGSDVARELLTGVGAGTPFVNVSFTGLLWGYEDDLPCLKMTPPVECDDGSSPFSSTSDDEWDMDDDFGAWRTKREVGDFKKPHVIWEKPGSEWHGKTLPKSEFIDCKCNWGLFRGRNITLRKPIEFFTGVGDVSKRGTILEYDRSPELGYWAKGSTCDNVAGTQDSSTLPPKITKDMDLNVFIALMCRKTPMVFEKEVEHMGLKALRYVPTANFLGSPDDPNPMRRNEENACYCLENENPAFRCFKTGVMNMKPCKRESMAPLALSQPHFYEADRSYLDAVEGLNPNKQEHEFYIDVMPEFGFPLAMRPKFQLNMVIGRHIDPGWMAIRNLPDELVLPFLWAQDGFSKPSEEMASAIKFGLDASTMLPRLGATVCFVLGGIMVLTSLAYFIWHRTAQSKSKKNAYTVPLN